MIALKNPSYEGPPRPAPGAKLTAEEYEEFQPPPIREIAGWAEVDQIETLKYSFNEGG